jgi:AcrR family transcriptional regulator
MKTETDSPEYERIFQAAEHRFFEQGPSRVRMDDLAHDLGMSKKTIYKLIPGKEQLMQCIIERTVQKMRQKALSILDDDTLDFPEKSRLFLSHLSDKLSQINSHLLIDLERFFPRTFAIVEQVRRDNLPTLLGKLITEGQKSGYVRDDVDKAFFCECYLQAVQGLMRRDSFERHGLQPKDIPAKLAALFFEGICTPQYSQTFSNLSTPQSNP